MPKGIEDKHCKIGGAALISGPGQSILGLPAYAHDSASDNFSPMLVQAAARRSARRSNTPPEFSAALFEGPLIQIVKFH